jgi:8-oxoguanine deaminase
MAQWIRSPLAILADGAEEGVVVADGKIVELVPRGAKPIIEIAESFGAEAHVVLPGLINTHHHFWQTLTRAFPPSLDKGLFEWLKALYPVWARLRPEQHRLGSRLAMAELLLSGCTTAVDHHLAMPAGLEQAIDIQMEEAERLGLRVVLGRGSQDLSVDDGGLPPASLTESIDTILADCERLVARWHQRGPGAMRQVALAPCAPFAVTADLMRESADMAERLDLRLHTHLAETEDEIDYCRARYGMRPLDYVAELGWLTSRVWFAHGIHFTTEEIARLGAAKAGIAHCPTSNMILGSGVCRAPELEAKGAAVGLAVDGAASQDCSNLMQEVRQAFLVQRAVRGVAAVSHRDPLRWATEGSARCIGRPDLGRIAVGLQADLALYRLDELRFSGSGDPLAALVICGAHQADRVMIAGKWVVIDAAVPGLDLAELRRDHQAAADRLQAAT